MEVPLSCSKSFSSYLYGLIFLNIYFFYDYYFTKIELLVMLAIHKWNTFAIFFLYASLLLFSFLFFISIFLIFFLLCMNLLWRVREKERKKMLKFFMFICHNHYDVVLGQNQQQLKKMYIFIMNKRKRKKNKWMKIYIYYIE